MIDNNIRPYLNRIGDMPNAFGSTRTLVKQVATIAGYDLNRGEMVYAKREDKYYFGLELEQKVELTLVEEVPDEGCKVPLVADVAGYAWEEGDGCFLHDNDDNLYFVNSDEEVIQVATDDEVFYDPSTGEIYTWANSVRYSLSGRRATYIGHSGDVSSGQVIPTNGQDQIAFRYVIFDKWDDSPTPKTAADIANEAIVIPSISGAGRMLCLYESYIRWIPNNWGEVRVAILVNGIVASGATAFSYPIRGMSDTYLTTSFVHEYPPAGSVITMVIDNATDGGIIGHATLSVSMTGR